MQLHLEIGAAHRRAQISVGGRDPRAVLDHDLPGARPFGLRAVEVAGCRDLERGARGEKGLADWVHARGDIAHVYGSPCAVELGSTPAVVLELPEPGQHLRPRPPGVAGVAPV